MHLRFPHLAVTSTVSLLIVLGCGCHPLDTVQARRTAREGNALYRDGDYAGAVTKYRQALALDAGTPNANLNLGYALFNVYDPDAADAEARAAATDAVAAFDEHLSREPEDERATIFRIKTLLRAAPHDAALADKAFALFSAMLAANPADHEARQYLVSLFIDTRRYAQAASYFAPALRQNPGDLETMKALAIIADKSGDAVEAVRWYRRRAAAVNDPAQKASLYYELGTFAWNVLHYQPERLLGVEGMRLADLGIEACNEAMALEENYAEAMAYANLLYLERVRFEATEDAKYIDQTLAFALRQKAVALTNSGAAKATAASTPQAQ